MLATLQSGLDPATLFDLPRPARASRIVVAMSGGVDSSVVAALAAASGAETIGVTLQLYDYGAATGRKGACCAGDDIRDARAVADRLGIAHYVFDHESAFREEVVERFADDYIAGRTPIPCVRCNMGPKFTDLLRMAKELGADCLATGHYVRRVNGTAGAELARHAQQVGELGPHVAADARDRRAPGEVVVGEALDHLLAKGAFMIEHVMRDAEPVGDRAGIADVVTGAARSLTPGRGAVIVKLQRDADHFGAACRRERGHHRAIHSA